MPRLVGARNHDVPLDAARCLQHVSLGWLGPLFLFYACAGPSDNLAGTSGSSQSAHNVSAIVSEVDPALTWGGDSDGGEAEEGATITTTAAGLKVAFIGDQGSKTSSKAVLALIESEGAELVLHQGDLDYEDDPALWEAMITEVLGDDFPYFVSVGNHDEDEWPGYQRNLVARLQKVPEATCRGDLGVRSVCTFKGLFFILSGIGTVGEDLEHEAFIIDELAQSNHVWRVCSWHKNQNDMQVGGKGNSVGWAAYRACQNAGAIIATGHEHSYTRTMNLRDLGNQETGHGARPPLDELTVKPGQTFVFVSGLGGKSKRDFHVEHGKHRWWATVYTSNVYIENGTPVPVYSHDFGALFITFNVDGDPRKAEGYFKTIDGEVIDEFSVTSAN